MGNKGVSLLEMMILLGSASVIIGFLVWIIHPAEFLAQIRDSQRIAKLNQLQAALSLYLLDHPKETCDGADSPLANLSQKFSYVCDPKKKTFELTSDLESARYSSGGKDDIESKDGGNQPGIYEIGNDPGLDLR